MACTTSTGSNAGTDALKTLGKGTWRGVFQLGETNSGLEIPFTFEVIDNDHIIIQNGEERIKVTDITIDGNQLSIKMPVFDSEFKLTNKLNQWEGQWHNYAKEDYQIPFTATKDETLRFPTIAHVDTPVTLIPHRWEVMFSPETEDAYPAIGLFQTDIDGNASGTFLTETGDYRYLAGNFNGKALSLSCFDGAHAFLFKADLQADGSLKGNFWSGKHWEEPWMAQPNDSFELTAMDELTYLKEGYETLAFTFKDESGEDVSLTDERFQNKVTIVQIMGTWCPNCMDETRMLVDFYEKYHDQGLEIIALDYEIKDDFEHFKKCVARTRKDLNITYPILFGGYANKKDAGESLPMLNHIMSYPTSVFIDRAGKVRAIHTGFSGPGTGVIYDQQVQKTIMLIEELLAESHANS